MRNNVLPSERGLRLRFKGIQTAVIGTEMMRGRWLVFLFILLLGAFLSSATAKACQASAFVTNVGNAFMGAARAPTAAAFSGVTARYTDLRGISMFALGPHRKLLGKSQEAEYLALTRGYIGRFMMKHSARFSGSGMTIKDCVTSSNTLTVSTRMSNGKKIIFTSERNGDLDLYTMNVNGSDVKQVTHQLGYDGGAFFSPDGKSLIFRASRPKTEEEIKIYKDLLLENMRRLPSLEKTGNASKTGSKVICSR